MNKPIKKTINACLLDHMQGLYRGKKLELFLSREAAWKRDNSLVPTFIIGGFEKYDRQLANIRLSNNNLKRVIGYVYEVDTEEGKIYMNAEGGGICTIPRMPVFYVTTDIIQDYEIAELK